MIESAKHIEELKQIINGLPVASLLVDPDGVTLAANEAAPQIFGISANRGSRNLSRKAWFKSLIKAARAGQKRQTIRLIQRTRSSKSRCKVAAITVYEAGRVSGLLLVAVRSGELRADLQYRRLLDDLLEPVAVHIDTIIHYANGPLAELFGITSPDELIGRSITDFVHPDYRAIVAQRMRMVKAGHVADLIEEKIISAQGAILDVEVRASRVHFHGEMATQVLVRDVTRQKQMQAGLQASQQRYRVLTESVRDYAVVALDCDGTITSWNAAASVITEFTAEEMIGSSLAKLFSLDEESPDAVLRVMFDTASESGRHETELWARRNRGADYWASLIVTAMRDPEGTVVGYTAVLHDLSRQREIENRLRKSEEQLRHAQKMDAIGRLAAGIAHDFKNLITAIHGHAQFLLEDLPHASELRSDVVEIKRAADRAADLTRQLLTFARKQDMESKEIDVNDVVTNLEKMLRRLIRADLELETSLGSGIPGVLADRGQIEQVIMNLVVNARDAIPEDGKITIQTSALDLDERYTAGGLDLEPGRYVLIGVTDTGIGMDPATQRQIFEPFFTTKREGEGTGLGLATVYGIVRQSGGHISVYSEPGRGSTIKVFLPAASGPAAPPSATPPAVVSEPTALTNTVLVVEDDDAIRSLTTRILRSRGYPVLTAHDGASALTTLKAHPGRVDVLLTDLMMPGIGGEELASRVRQLRPDIAVIFMSGFSEPTQRDSAKLHNALFLEKPFAPDDLARRVAEALHRAS